MINIKFSLFASPYLLTKRIDLVDGKLVKTPAANTVAAVKRMTVATLVQVMAVLDTLTDKQAACWGVSIADVDESVVETSERVEAGQAVAGAISRTRKFMTWANAAGVFMADLDDNHTPESARDALLAAWRAVFGNDDLAEVEMFYRPSVSAGVYAEGIEPLQGGRIYFAVERAEDIPRIGDALVAGMWLNGHGFVRPSKSGAALMCCPVDATVWQPERIDFVAPAVLGDGVMCKRPASVRFGEAGRILPAFVVIVPPSVESEVEALQARAKEDARPALDAAFAIYCRARAADHEVMLRSKGIEDSELIEKAVAEVVNGLQLARQHHALDVGFPALTPISSKEEAIRIARRLIAPYADFEFFDGDGHANHHEALVLMLVLMVVIRPTVVGFVLLITAVRAGAGKTYLARCLLAEIGEKLLTTNWNVNDDEAMKILAMHVKKHLPFLCIDNFDHAIGGPLEAFADKEAHEMGEIRLLGKNEAVHVPNTAQIIATGINLRSRNEAMARRSFEVVLAGEVAWAGKRMKFPVAPSEYIMSNWRERKMLALSLVRWGHDQRFKAVEPALNSLPDFDRYVRRLVHDLFGVDLFGQVLDNAQEVAMQNDVASPKGLLFYFIWEMNRAHARSEHFKSCPDRIKTGEMTFQPASEEDHGMSFMLGFHLGQSNKAGLAKATDRLRPTKDFFDPFAQAQADPVTRVSSGPTINRTLRLSRHVRGHALLTHRLDETRRIVILVSPQGGAPLQRAHDHRGRRFTLRRAGGQRRFHIDRQSVSIFHQGMAHVTEPGLVPLGLLEQARLRIGGRGMGVVLAFSPFEIHRRVTTAAFRRLARTVLGDKALHRGPGFNQRAIDREVIGRDQTVPLCQAQHLAEESTGNAFIEQTVTVLRETAVIPDLVIHVQTDKPAIEEVVVNVLHKLPFRTNRVQRLNQAGAQQTLGRNRRAAGLGVQHLEVSMQRGQNAVDQRTQFTQRVRHRNPLFQCPIAKDLRLGHVGAAHEIYISLNSNDKLYHTHTMGGVFQRPVRFHCSAVGGN